VGGLLFEPAPCVLLMLGVVASSARPEPLPKVHRRVSAGICVTYTALGAVAHGVFGSALQSVW
jgi:hypothetical protein